MFGFVAAEDVARGTGLMVPKPPVLRITAKLGEVALLLLFTSGVKFICFEFVLLVTSGTFEFYLPS